MGRHPEPTALKLLKGSAQQKDVSEPVPSDVPIRCPNWVPELGKQLWRELAPDLIAKKVLSHWDVPAFAALCTAYALYREAVESLKADGSVVSGHRGVKSKNPYHQVARDQLASFVSLASRFGLSPSDRAKLSMGEDRQPGEDLLTQGWDGA